MTDILSPPNIGPINQQHTTPYTKLRLLGQNVKHNEVNDVQRQFHPFTTPLHQYRHKHTDSNPLSTDDIHISDESMDTDSADDANDTEHNATVPQHIRNKLSVDTMLSPLQPERYSYSSPVQHITTIIEQNTSPQPQSSRQQSHDTPQYSTDTVHNTEHSKQQKIVQAAQRLKTRDGSTNIIDTEQMSTLLHKHNNSIVCIDPHTIDVNTIPHAVQPSVTTTTHSPHSTRTSMKSPLSQTHTLDNNNHTNVTKIDIQPDITQETLIARDLERRRSTCLKSKRVGLFIGFAYILLGVVTYAQDPTVPMNLALIGIGVLHYILLGYIFHPLYKFNTMSVCIPSAKELRLIANTFEAFAIVSLACCAAYNARENSAALWYMTAIPLLATHISLDIYVTIDLCIWYVLTTITLVSCYLSFHFIWHDTFAWITLLQQLVLMSIQCIFASTSQYVVKQHVDELWTTVTKMNYIQGELETARDGALRAAQAKSEFLANMSHEIRTPLNSVIGLCTLLLETELNNEQQDYLKTVIQSGESLLTVINDILLFSKLESQNIQLEHIPFSLYTAVEDVMQMFQLVSNERSIELILDIIPNTPNIILGDMLRLKQILSNLVGNAIKFSKNNGFVLLTVTTKYDTNKQRTMLEFHVIDNGVGIAVPQQSRLFKAFSQVDASTSRVYGGTGLGLAICKSLIEAMNGEIGVQSAENIGSNFWFTVDINDTVQQQQHDTGPLSLISTSPYTQPYYSNNTSSRLLEHSHLHNASISTPLVPPHSLYSKNDSIVYQHTPLQHNARSLSVDIPNAPLRTPVIPQSRRIESKQITPYVNTVVNKPTQINNVTEHLNKRSELYLKHLADKTIPLLQSCSICIVDTVESSTAIAHMLQQWNVESTVINTVELWHSTYAQWCSNVDTVQIPNIVLISDKYIDVQTWSPNMLKRSLADLNTKSTDTEHKSNEILNPLTKRTPPSIVLLSHNMSKQQRRTAHSNGFSTSVNKPVLRTSLLRALYKAISYCKQIQQPSIRIPLLSHSDSVEPKQLSPASRMRHVDTDIYKTVSPYSATKRLAALHGASKSNTNSPVLKSSTINDRISHNQARLVSMATEQQTLSPRHTTTTQLNNDNVVIPTIHTLGRPPLSNKNKTRSIRLPQRNTLNILVAEDNVVNQKVIQKMLTHLGYNSVQVVDNGQLAVDAVQERCKQHQSNNNDSTTALPPFDVILMDISMPVMNGMDATKTIRSTVCNVCQPIIYAVTANVLPDDATACIAAGMNDCLTKPILLNVLKRTLYVAAQTGRTGNKATDNTT